ncbi:sulfofructose kinase [Aliiruegeria haliotis]|uniref:Sulfofructose kinase n=1 Tax=Aliiruegeria haliotis TaxID=1280846 RepID=A0A2T0RSU1_9RHOB|nr:PfkB family carbohydrate kinase [Aliiruegeria haliotis]PRY24266.1 sulfofructose kinase [Aliiruegeria haliotis]
MSDVLVLGMAVVDFVMSMQSLPTEATKYRADKARIVGGGVAANAACAIARLGGAATLGARLGDDPLGDLILADLQKDGVDTTLVHRTPDGRSSFSSVYVDAAGERQIMNFRGEGLTETTGWISEAPRSRAVLVDTRWTEGAAAALDLARDWDVPGIVDGEAPLDPVLMEKATHLAFSRQGLRSVTGTGAIDAGLEMLARRYGNWICVTDGANGVFYTTPNGIAHIPAFRVEVVDTLGAGDVWHGAFALSLAEGAGEPDAVRFANAAAALKCMTFGGRAGTPDRSAVQTILKENE